jgi:hypothetical protein
MRPSFASPQRHEKIRPRHTHDPETWCPVFGQDHAQKRGRRSAERRMPTIAAHTDKRRRLSMYRRQVYAACATHPLRGRAPIGARPPSGATPRLSSETVTSLTQLQAMLPGTWTARDPENRRSRGKESAGVTRPILSQSSDSTSRLGRNTEGNDAQSRPGAGCKPARRHRTRSASESALAKASLDERDLIPFVSEMETTVKRRLRT